jgi:hypothetical protein
LGDEKFKQKTANQLLGMIFEKDPNLSQSSDQISKTVSA